MKREDVQAIADHLSQQTRGAAQAYSGNLLGKVKGGSGGFYDLELENGQTLKSVQNGTRVKWQADQWVTYQTVNGVYQIASAGAAEAG